MKPQTKEELREELAAYGVMLLPKDASRLMRFLAFFLGGRFITDFWTTYRLPFCKPVITYPPAVKDVWVYTNTIRHELHHCRQFAPWYGPYVVTLLVTLLPLPVLFSGRWFVERRAYLSDILYGTSFVEITVQSLWRNYGWCWPRPMMRRWFYSQIRRVREGEYAIEKGTV